MSFLGSAAGAVAGGVASIIGGALSNSAARHAATVANQRNVYNYQQFEYHQKLHHSQTSN